jgi:hypothetical protein
MTPEERQRTIDFILESQANSVVRLDRLEAEQTQQKENIDALLRVTHDLVKVSRNVVGRTKRLETRSDSVDEMIKVLRQLLEASLRRPDNPRQ